MSLHDDVIKWKYFPHYWPFCVGNSPFTNEFPSQRPVPRSFDVFFDLRLNKRLSERSWGWWIDTPSCSLWRHRNVTKTRDRDKTGSCTLMWDGCNKYASRAWITACILHCLVGCNLLNSLAPEAFDYSLRFVNFKLISMMNILSIFCEIAIGWMSQNLTDHLSTLVQVMAWCRQATSHYLSQCWPRSLSPYDVTRSHISCWAQIGILSIPWLCGINKLLSPVRNDSILYGLFRCGEMIKDAIYFLNEFNIVILSVVLVEYKSAYIIFQHGAYRPSNYLNKSRTTIIKYHRTMQTWTYDNSKWRTYGSFKYTQDVPFMRETDAKFGEKNQHAISGINDRPRIGLNLHLPVFDEARPRIRLHWKNDYRQVSNIRRTLVGN